MTYSIIEYSLQKFGLLTLGMHVQRGLQYLICVCVCVCLSVSSNLTSRAITRPTRNTNAPINVFPPSGGVGLRVENGANLMPYPPSPPGELLRQYTVRMRRFLHKEKCTVSLG